ncbi:MAG TPA: XRE family transcriptional regulator [Clostridiales bacterium]|nr:XRE family transcriptional regulator [Clostridiales bacterium]
MDFGEQLRKIRKDRGLTQEQVASKLNVSRQAISNWENNKNLPDLEMVVELSVAFDLSLDQLILGGKNMNNMTEKLIKDGSETRRAKMNLIAITIGAVLLFFGVTCILIKANSVEYIDAEGFLHENFFLLPIGFLFIFSGLVTFAVTGIKNIVVKLNK